MTNTTLSQDPRRGSTVAQPPHPSRTPNAIAYWRKRSLGKPGRCLSQAELAKLTGKSVGSIGRFERGERLPRLETLLMLSAALRVPPQILYPELWRERCDWAQERRRELGLIHSLVKIDPSD